MPSTSATPKAKYSLEIFGSASAIRRIFAYIQGTLAMGFGPNIGDTASPRAVRLVMLLALRHEMSELWITCDPENVASRRTCELAGAELVEIVDLPTDIDMYRDGERQKCRYRLDLSQS